MSPQLYIAMQGVLKFFKKHHPLVSIIVIAGFIGFTTFTLYDIQTKSLIGNELPPTTISGFDQKTVERIKSLQLSKDGADRPPVFPSPRVNPFTE